MNDWNSKADGRSKGLRLLICVCTFAIVAMGEVRGAWAQAIWTSSADAPKGALTSALEGQRHDRSIELAKKGDIDLVFFGTTETEMWSWPDRGRVVWDREFGSVKAANFGSQGTQPSSLLWRMKNGELDGYQAKFVVWQTWGPGSTSAGTQDYAPIVAEIRARQPQAKILLVAPMPRGQWDRDRQRQIAADHAATLAGLVDNATVFYMNIGERFFFPNGSFNQAMWRSEPLVGVGDVGTQTAAFEVWAQELQPWLDRFVR